MSKLLLAVASLPLLSGWNPSLSINLSLESVAVVAESGEPLVTNGYLNIPMLDDECETRRDSFLENLAEFWPAMGAVRCVATQLYTYAEFETAIKLVPAFHEAASEPEIVVEVSADAGQLQLTARSTPPLGQLMEAVTEYGMRVPVPEIGLVIDNDTGEEVALSFSLVYVNGEPLPASTSVSLPINHRLWVELPDVASSLLVGGQDHVFAHVGAGE